MAGKHRRWEAKVLISASGPEYDPIFSAMGKNFRPRAVADLEWTTSDVNYLSAHFKNIYPDSSEHEKTYRLINPSIAELQNILRKAGRWLRSHCNHPDWDGGALLLVYAGHGDEGGELVLKDDELYSPEMYIRDLLRIAEQETEGHRLRVSALMDSCHSGEFGLRVLDLTINIHDDKLVPFNLLLSCCSDESSYEDGGLGHGIFTYCFSVNNELGNIAATAIQPDNSFGPSISIASGEKGVGLITSGAQNPICYRDGTGYIKIGSSDFSIFHDGDSDTWALSLEQMRTKVLTLRDENSAKYIGLTDFSISRIKSGASRAAAKELKEALFKLKANDL
ncbi:MAG: caspase family protein [Hyphomicrobiales bacterium]